MSKKLTLPVLKKECDDMLTPIIKKMYPKCMFCDSNTQVAHHHFNKSKSAVLRYDIDNLVNLCNPCHFMLHKNEGYWACKILENRGLVWFKRLDKKNKKKIKNNKAYYEKHYKRLKKLLNNE